jgi:aromatic ring hydroxylase
MDRVFMCGETEAAGFLALTFVKFHRFTAVSYKLPLLEMLAGSRERSLSTTALRMPVIREN